MNLDTLTIPAIVLDSLDHPGDCVTEGFSQHRHTGLPVKAKTLLRFFRWFGKDRTCRLKYICSDMWRPYLKVIAKKAQQAIHILGRFHIMMHFNKAIDKVRAGEAKELERKGVEPILRKSRWLFLKHSENLTAKQDTCLARLLQYNLKTVRSYLLKDDFQFFWG